MALTWGDLAEQSTGAFDKPVVKRFMETSRVLSILPVKPVNGPDYRYRQQDRLNAVMNRAINQAYTESSGTLTSRSEDLTILGTQFFADRALKRLQRQGGDAIDLIAENATMAATALARELERQCFEGDKLVNPLEMQGFRPRCISDQVQLAGSGGATLTLAMIDALIDSVAMVGEPHFFCNKLVRRKWTNLAMAQSTIARIQYTSIDGLGRQIQSYDGIPIDVVEDGWDASTILDAEDPGDGTSDSYSLYLVMAGIEEGVHLIINGDGPLVDCYQVTKETEAGPPGELWRAEMYPGMVVKHPRAIGRLRGILV